MPLIGPARPRRILLVGALPCLLLRGDAHPFALRLEAAKEIVLSSAVRGVYPGALPDRPPRFATGARLRAAAPDRIAEAVVS